MINHDTPIWQLTVGEFKELIQSTMQQPQKEEPKGKNLVYGIKGIAELFNCSVATAQRIKNSGKINKAISQVGRKIVVNADLALELYKR